MRKVILRITLSIVCLAHVGCRLPSYSSSNDVRVHHVIHDSEERPVNGNTGQPRRDRATPFRTYGGVI